MPSNRSPNPLDIEVNLERKRNSEKPDIVLKLGRPRNLPVPEPEPITNTSAMERMADLTDPRVDVGIERINTAIQDIHSQAAAFASDEDLEEHLRTIDWGDYDVEKLVDVMSTLSEVVTGVKLQPYQIPIQKRMIRSVLINDGETISILISRQAGKTEVVSCTTVVLCTILPALAHIFPDQLGLYSDGFWVGMYAPVGEQAKTIFDRTKRRASSESALAAYDDPDISTGIEKNGCRWTNGSFVFMQSASPKANIESKTYHLLVLDEAQGATEAVVSKSLEPMLAWGNGTMVMLGTVSESPCYYYDVIQQNKANDIEKPESLRNHYEYDYTEVQKHNPRYRVHVEKQIKKHGIESRYFQMAYGLRWMFEEGRAVSDADLKKYSMYVNLGYTKHTDGICVAGIDLARRRYSSVVTVGQLLRAETVHSDDAFSRTETGYVIKVCDWLELKDIPYTEQRSIMRSFFSNYPNLQWVTVDSTGAGDAVFEQMELEWTSIPDLESFQFGSPSKAHLASLFYEYLWKRQLLIPNTRDARKQQRWQNFYLQMINLERVTKNGYTYLAKADRENARDDYADSLFLMLHAARRVIAAKLGILESVEESNLFSQPRRDQMKMGIEGIRESVRRGTYSPSSGGPTSMRDARARKLLQGMI